MSYISIHKPVKFQVAMYMMLLQQLIEQAA